MPSARERRRAPPAAARSPPCRSRATSAPSPRRSAPTCSSRKASPTIAAAADRSLKALFATGLFSDVVIDMQGSTLVVKVTENPIINRVAFEGNTQDRGRQAARRSAVEAAPGLHPRARAVRRRAHPDHLPPQRPLQRRRSSPRSSSSSRAASTSSSRSTKATSPASSASASSATSISATARCAARSAPRESAWWRFLSSDDRFDPDRLNLDRELLRKFYLSEGYADFRVVSAVAELAPNREGFFITFTINEGERYKFGKVDVSTRFQGLDVDVLKSYLTMGEGDWYDADEVEKTVTALSDAVGTLGYAFVDVRPNIRRNKDNLDGRRDLRHPGRSARLCRAHQHLRQHAYARQGDPPRVPPRRGRRLQHRQGAPQPGAPAATSASSRRSTFPAAPGSAPDKTNLEVQVVEQSTGDISFGAGYLDDVGHPGRHLDQERNLPGQGPGTAARPVARHLEHPDRSQLHRALLPGPRDGGGLRHLPDVERPPGSRLLQRPQPRLRAARRLGLHRAHARRSCATRCARPRSTTSSPGPRTIVQLQAGSSVVSEVAETIAWDTRDTRAQHDQGPGCCATRWRWPA